MLKHFNIDLHPVEGGPLLIALRDKLERVVFLEDSAYEALVIPTYVLGYLAPTRRTL